MVYIGFFLMPCISQSCVLAFSYRPSKINVCFFLVSSADNLYKQFGPRSGPTKCRACSGSKLFDTLVVFLEFFSKKIILKKNQQTTKKHAKLPSRL